MKTALLGCWFVLATTRSLCADPGIIEHTLDSEHQDGPTRVRVLLPARLEKERRYPVVYVLPVEARAGKHYGDGLAEVKKLGLHDRHGLVFVMPEFSRLPWYADHPAAKKLRQETHLLHAVVPFIEKTYPVLAKPEGRLLLGFSKSGWGAFSLLLRHPDLFGKAAAWDAPLAMDAPGRFGSGEVFATGDNFAQYQVTKLLERQAGKLGPEKRLAVLGYDNFRKDHVTVHELMERLKVPHEYRDGPKRKHDWHSGWVAEAVEFLANESATTAARFTIGLTRKQTPIYCEAPASDVSYSPTKKMRILLVGLDAEKQVRVAQDWFYKSPDAIESRKLFSIAAVPVLHPDGQRISSFPPKGDAYANPNDPEAEYLWRWLGTFAPDLVVVCRDGKELTWALPEALGEKLGNALQPAPGKTIPGSLADALGKSAPANVGTIPALEMTSDSGSKGLLALLKALEKTRFLDPSAAQLEQRKRLERKPLDVAKQLATVYGRELAQVEYIGAMAVVGRLRLGEREAVERILAPYLSGEKPTGAEKAGPSQLAGHLVFGELARPTKNEKAILLIRRAADRCLGEGVPGHSEMSDSVFMGCPLLALTGSLTGEKKYYEACERNLAFMRKLCLRKDGLYRHSPLDETAWGRGNGFPALGLALSLSDLPRDFAGRETVLRAFREHIDALLKHQELDGSWRQVIDLPGSYRELSCTCMITFAMARGVRLAWLEKARFEEPIRRAWRAILVRVAADGSLIDVCTGTGKQKSLRNYLDRKAILGRDPRGGAMALLAAVEMAALQERP